MKSFTIIYVRTVKADQIIRARNEREAREKFNKERPDVRIVDVQEWHEGMDIYE